MTDSLAKPACICTREEIVPDCPRCNPRAEGEVSMVAIASATCPDLHKQVDSGWDLSAARATCEAAGLVVMERRTEAEWRAWYAGRLLKTPVLALRALGLILPDTAKGEGE